MPRRGTTKPLWQRSGVLADLASSRPRCGAPRRRPGGRAPAPADACRGGVRLSPGHGGPAPKLDQHEKVAELLPPARVEPYDYNPAWTRPRAARCC